MAVDGEPVPVSHTSNMVCRLMCCAVQICKLPFLRVWFSRYQFYTSHLCSYIIHQLHLRTMLKSEAGDTAGDPRVPIMPEITVLYLSM
jgi:hypothetical protein